MDSGRGVQTRQYSGVSPHTDHIHMEISVAASELDADFYREGLPEPERMACGPPLPETGALIDAPDPCFELLGPDDYWRSVEDAGLGDGLFFGPTPFKTTNHRIGRAGDSHRARLARTALKCTHSG